ncbi:MAG: RluA family pseudouridine synthase [Candidatus Omnitrophica bacterium]|nr:RluA family pseudouridine synthase [Candidatus Omnitrophota bacterium]
MVDKDKITIKVDKSGVGKRLDVFLAETHHKLSTRSHIKKIIDDGGALVNNAVSKPHHKLREGDVVEVDLTKEKKEGDLAAENIPLDIVYEDEHLLVVNKPAGMASHPARGMNAGTLVNALLYHCGNLSGMGQTDRPGIVHRLDKDTTGLMVVAKDDQTHRLLAGQFKERTIKKRYIAFVKGAVELDTGLIEAPIGRHPSQRQKLAVRFSESRDALTEYKVVKRFSDCTMLELTPKTGRMHQLRVHLAYIGHPILGDAVYGKKSDLISRQALHAHTLGFTHPVTKEYLEFKAEMPTDMKRLLATVGSDIISPR